MKLVTLHIKVKFTDQKLTVEKLAMIYIILSFPKFDDFGLEK